MWSDPLPPLTVSRLAFSEELTFASAAPGRARRVAPQAASRAKRSVRRTFVIEDIEMNTALGAK
jgi:hypothetical protein